MHFLNAIIWYFITHTLGSNTGNYFTITSGPSTVELITFAAIYWGSLATLQLIAIVLYLIRG